jgi:hypothetical protein
VSLDCPFFVGPSVFSNVSVPTSYKTPALLLIPVYIYIVKFDKNLVGDRGNKTIYVKMERSIVI